MAVVVGVVGFAVAVVASTRYIRSAGQSGALKATTDAAAAWKTEAEAREARIERIISECKDEVAGLMRRVDEAISQRDQERGRAEEAIRANTELRELVMGERVPDALATALSEISTGVIEYFDTLVAGFKAQLTLSLEANAGLLATMEEEYLRPMLRRLERRSQDHPFEGPDRRKGNGQG